MFWRQKNHDNAHDAWWLWLSNIAPPPPPPRRDPEPEPRVTRR